MIAAMAAAIMLAACQSSGNSTQDVLGVGQEGALQENGGGIQSGLRSEVIGEGSVDIALLLPFSGAGAQESAAIRNGAALAIEDLADGRLKLAVLDSADTGSASAAVSALAPKIIAVPATASGLALSGSVPAIAFVENGAGRPVGTFAFIDSPADALVAGMRHVSRGTGASAVFVPEGQKDRVERAISRSGFSATVIAYRSGEGAEAIASRAPAQLSIAAFAGADATIPAIVAALRARSGGALLVVGNSGWGSALIANPAVNGATIARPDPSSHGLIAGRYQKKFGLPPTEMALYGYDYIAVVAGIVRFKGPEFLTRETLLSPAGFRGATGAFRFKPDGSVERLYEMTVIQGGRPTVTRPAAAGF